jgi:hypothetical protein
MITVVFSFIKSLALVRLGSLKIDS